MYHSALYEDLQLYIFDVFFRVSRKQQQFPSVVIYSRHQCDQRTILTLSADVGGWLSLYDTLHTEFVAKNDVLLFSLRDLFALAPNFPIIGSSKFRKYVYYVSEVIVLSSSCTLEENAGERENAHVTM